jgi:predicted DNA-binding transcriptional regulator YafY
VIDRLERLINLVIALRETRRPLTADEIRRRVAGYGQDEYEAFRRMFERDKADLRALGVPVATVVSDVADDIEGYRVDPRAYDLPAVAFPDDELAALGLAVQATGLSDDAMTGLRKLAVGRADAEREVMLGGPGGPWLALPLDDPNREVLAEAQLTRTRVRFRYRRSDGTVDERVVEPHGMVHRRGFWYVVGRDRDRGAMRSFRLDRIDGSVRTSGRAAAFPRPERDVEVEDVLPDEALSGTVTATVAATEALAWRVARRARGSGRPLDDGRTAYDVVGAGDALVAWVLEEGPELELLAPAELRARVLAELDAVLGSVAPRDGGQA